MPNIKTNREECCFRCDHVPKEFPDVPCRVCPCHKEAKCCEKCNTMFKSFCYNCPCHSQPVEQKEWNCPCGKPAKEFSLCSKECEKKYANLKVEDSAMKWEDGSLTFDEVRNIMEVCNVKDVEIEQDYLLISFVPKNVTGKVWKELKEKMHRITGE